MITHTSGTTGLPKLVVHIDGPGDRPLPIVCTREDKPIDTGRWRQATGDWPQLAEPVQIPMAELPRTVALKTRRVELSRIPTDSKNNPERTPPISGGAHLYQGDSR